MKDNYLIEKVERDCPLCRQSSLCRKKKENWRNADQK